MLLNKSLSKIVELQQNLIELQEREGRKENVVTIGLKEEREENSVAAVIIGLKEVM